MTNIPSFIWNMLSGLPLIPASKEAAESWLSRGELGLVIFGAIIVVGLIGEYWADKNDERRKNSWIPPLPQKHWNWKLLFAGVVVLSIIGEFVSDADIWITSDVLQTISDSEIAALNAQIAPRRLLPNQQEAIAKELQQFAGKTVMVGSYILDVEGAVIGGQITEAIKKASLSTNSGWLMSVLGNGPIALGIHITGKDAPLVEALLKAIGKYQVVFSQEPFPDGFTSTNFARPIGPPPDAVVFVGAKPITE
jgi:hypothetical protein